MSEVPENGDGELGVDWTEMDPGHPWVRAVPSRIVVSLVDKLLVMTWSLLLLGVAT